MGSQELAQLTDGTAATHTHNRYAQREDCGRQAACPGKAEDWRMGLQTLRTSKIDGKPSQSGKEAPAPALTWDVPVCGAAQPMGSRTWTQKHSQRKATQRNKLV